MELEFLHEIGRLKPNAHAVVIEALASDIGLRVCTLTFRAVVEQAVKESWGRDPFDRLIVANAKAVGASLITRDERIRKHCSIAIW